MDREQRAGYLILIKKGILVECVLVMLAAVIFARRQSDMEESRTVSNSVLSIENDYIKWVDFTVSYEALCKAYDWDVETHGTEHEVNWVDLLAYTAARTGGSFDKDALKTMEKAARQLSEGEKTIEEMTEDLKYFAYYKEAYDAAIGGLVGEYQVETAQTACVSGEAKTGSGGSENSDTDSGGAYETVYGLKGYFPLARGFDYTHYDDFGVSRSYGYKRQHLGHDMMGLVGTPIRIKYRICASKNNAQILCFGVKYAGLY